jgi:hypothetical protein
MCMCIWENKGRELIQTNCVWENKGRELIQTDFGRIRGGISYNSGKVVIFFFGLLYCIYLLCSDYCICIEL